MSWTRIDNTYIHGASDIVDKLDHAIYRLAESQKHGLYLTHVQDRFPLPKKLYGLDEQLIEHVSTTFTKNTKLRNIGVLLVGKKGSGKTVTAKQLCNMINLPTIIVDHAYGNLPAFLNQIKEDLIVFVDEYEKTFAKDASSLLTTMDGALDNGFRRIFLLTSNSLHVNENILQRPGRVRYLRHYGDLTAETINMVVDDALVHKHLRDETILFISRLQEVTIDIILSVIDEVNMFGIGPEKFKDIFNVAVEKSYCNLYEVEEDKTNTLIEEEVLISLYNKSYIGHHHDGYGRIVRIIDKYTVVVVDEKTKKERTLLQVPCNRLHRSFRSKDKKTKLSSLDEME